MDAKQRTIRVLLLVEDNPGDARLFREMLSEQGAEATELMRADAVRDLPERPRP